MDCSAGDTGHRTILQQSLQWLVFSSPAGPVEWYVHHCHHTMVADTDYLMLCAHWYLGLVWLLVHHIQDIVAETIHIKLVVNVIQVNVIIQQLQT